MNFTYNMKTEIFKKDHNMIKNFYCLLVLSDDKIVYS